MRPIRYGGRRVDLGARVLREERGIALLMAVGILFVLTLVLATVIFLTAASARDSQRTNAGQRAHALAEAGINNALAVLNANYPCSGCYPGNSALLPSRTTTYSNGSTTWWGTLQNAPTGFSWSDEWRLTSVGTVNNPTGPSSSQVTRKVTAVVPVVIPIATQIGENNPLNFIFSHHDIHFQQRVVVASPVYATRDLYLEQFATVSEWIGNVSGKFNKLAVGRDFYELQNANQVGHTQGTADTANDLGEAYITHQCATKSHDNNPSSATLHDCVWSYPSPGAGVLTDQLWAAPNPGGNPRNVIPANFLDYVPQLTCCNPYPDVASLAPSQSTMPAPANAGESNMGRLYRTAAPGPNHACTSGSVPFTFDGPGVAPPGDGQLNNSATPNGTPAIDLTPTASDYSCTSGTGQISWNHSTHQFYVQGTVFIDGSATITSPKSAQATVSGQGAIILTGTFMMKNALMCVRTTGTGASTDCDTSTGAWIPDDGALIIVADGDGGYDGNNSTQSQSNNVNAGEGIDIKSSDFQGGFIANKNISVDTFSKMQGPMLSVYYDVFAGQTNVLTFPPIQFSPSGGPDSVGPPPLAQLLPPQQFGGS
jgi:Tfp pilus assembly protein PilX